MEGFPAGAGVSSPGFIFWGLFAAFGLIVVGYVVWMFWIERREQTRQDENR